MTNKLKSIYLPLFMLLSLWTAAYAFVATLGAVSLTNLGLLTSSVPFAILLASLFIIKTARFDRSLNSLLLFSTLGSVLALIGCYLEGPSNLHLLAVLNTAGHWLYVRWCIVLPGRDSVKIGLGRLLPPLALHSIDGEPVDANEQLGRNTVWVFYRGNWCPVCLAQVRELADNHRILSAHNAEIVFVSPQPQDKTMRLATEFPLPFTFLVDEDNRAAKTLGIEHAYGLPQGFQLLGYSLDTVLPTVIITDPIGQVIYLDLAEHYLRRPDPKTFLTSLQRANERHA